MDENNKKDPYNFEKIEDGLQKRYKVIVSRREAYKKNQKRKKTPPQ